MDKRTDREKTKGITTHLLNEKSSFDDMRKSVKNDIQETIEHFNKVINSRWTWGDRKRYLIAWRSQISINGRVQGMIIDIWENLDQLNKAVVLLSDMMIKNQEKSTELEDALSKIKNTLKEPIIAKVAGFLEQIEKQTEKRKKVGETYRV